MGVADNQSYKTQYHFTDDFKTAEGEYPSIYKDPKINTSIKENPFRSNVEIEGGEIVLQPDLTALFKANGKRHSQGGMDVLLKPESFIFSDFDGLSFSKKDHERFELKEGSNKRPSSNTPAEVLKRNINLKHYNTMVNNLSDPFKDDLAKTTSALMLEKYIQSLGNIAYAQEEKKSFPDGIPAFSVGTAPVYDPELKNDIMASKQYARAGGKVNPYLRKAQMGGWGVPAGINAMFQRKANGQGDTATIAPPPQNPQTQAPLNWGLWPGDRLPIFKNRFGVTNAADKITDLDDIAQQFGYTGPKSNKAFQEFLYNSSPENKAIIDKWHNVYDDPSIAVPRNQRNRFDNKIGIRWQAAIQEILNPPTKEVTTPGQLQVTVKAPPIGTRGPEVPELDTTPQGSKRADWRFTPWQKLSHLYSGMNWANVKRYMPFRSRYNAVYVDPALVNPEQAVGDVQASSAQQLSSIRTLNPILRNAQAAQISGQVLNSLPGIRSQYDNQNAQILNNTRSFNVQTKNNETLVNNAYDQKYKEQATTARVNFDNMRQFMGDRWMNNIFRDVESNQKLAYNLLTLNNPAYGLDWNTGNLYRNPKSILDTQSNTQGDMVSKLLSDLIPKFSSLDPSVQSALLKTAALKGLPLSNSPNMGMKKGGKYKNPYK